MADQPAQEKTEQPTTRRLAKAHDEGQVPKSQELLIEQLTARIRRLESELSELRCGP